MQLALMVIAVVMVTTVVLGICGYLIDRSVARRERLEGR
jgi:hypothetical protein